MDSNPPKRSAPCWSDIVQKQPPLKPQSETLNPFLESCKSSKGVSVAIVDANAIIHGGEKLMNSADKFVSVSEVLEEVRDPVSRHRLAVMPFPVEIMEPSQEALKKVINFARATGDLQTLSDVDLKLIALTYTLEAQIHGINHLRHSPPPLHVVNVKKLPEKEMPGWGTNVPNLAEWEALEHTVDAGSDFDSRILPLKDMNLNLIPMDDHVGAENNSVDCSNDTLAEPQVDGDHGSKSSKIRKFMPPKKEVIIEGKKMVADGIDASQGEGDDNASDWLPAVSRSTHRRFLRRKARRELSEASKNLDHSDEDTNTDAKLIDNVAGELDSEFLQEGKVGVSCEVAESHDPVEVDESLNYESIVAEGDVDEISTGLDELEISSQTDESIGTSLLDDGSSEQSWMLRSLSDSSVACVTSDFAMQNVILQIGLRLLAPGGMQIRQLHRWILRCHACNNVTAEIGRIFCPKCGNGGTLRKVSATVGENGIVLAARRPRVTLRGTKFSLPLPQGGRDAITKNLILREDQLPNKLLYPKLKKKPNKQGMDILSSDDIFSHTADKKAPLKPPVRQALAVFSGKRNPNDNHFSRRKH
ncbi:RNA-binding NOB1-like protein [Tasmannia lanceolata]|uniref:RNA-binding NOB1-like protein n=1 Tax=Tasmannia lanceolata TaxID=3420 RepID=UPI004063AFF2